MYDCKNYTVVIGVNLLPVEYRCINVVVDTVIQVHNPRPTSVSISFRNHVSNSSKRHKSCIKYTYINVISCKVVDTNFICSAATTS